MLEEKPADQVAAEHGVSPNVVYLAKFHVLKWLREEGRGLIEEEEVA